MRALAACVLVLFAATLAGGVESGQACSCALPDPRAALAQADGAFVGTLVSRRQLDQQAVLEFAVDRALKGSIGKTVEVRTASSGAACGIEAPIGTRVGLVLERRDGAWHGHLCWQFAPEELLAAALPLPPPNGRGPVALIVGGGFGDSRLLTLDAHGRTLAYGRGGGRAGLVSMCPGRKHLVELAYIGSGSTLVARKTRTLRVQRRQLVNLPGGRYAQRLRCEDGSGTSAVIFSRGPVGDSPAGSALYRMRAGRVSTLWSGAAFDAEITSSAAYLSAGNSGKTLIRVDLSTGRTKRLATLPASTTSLKLNRAETLLAGIAASTGRPSQLVRVDLTRKPATVVVVPLSRGGGLWAGLLAADGPPSLRPRVRRHRGAHPRRLAAHAGHGSGGPQARRLLVGSSVFGTDQTLSLFRAKLPSGPQRIVRRLPGRASLLVAATL